MDVNWHWERALQYHERSKHSYESVRSGSYFLDWANKPHPFKKYTGLPSVQLPREFPRPDQGFFTTLLARDDDFSPRGVNVQILSVILFFTAGITRVLEVPHPPYRYYFRAAPGTGALHPTEIYVVVNDVGNLDAGIYHFNPLDWNLVQLRTGSWTSALVQATEDDAVETASFVLIFTCYGWKNAWKYRERSYRHWFWDTGVMLTNTMVTAHSFKLRTKLITGFQDDLINALLGIDGRKEGSIAIVPVNVGAREEKHHDELNDTIPPLTVRYVPLSRTEYEFKDVIDAYMHSRLTSSDDLKKWTDNVIQLREMLGQRAPPTSYLEKIPIPSWQELLASVDQDPPVTDVILKRGSARQYTHQPITKEELFLLLHSGTRVSFSADFHLEPDDSYLMNEWFLIVNAVKELESGSYYFDPIERRLYLLKKGLFREKSGYLCLEQALGADASVVFFLMVPLRLLLELLGNRGYRIAQLEAGILVESAWLAAHALGLGATGLTFYDDDIVRFFSPHSEGKEPTMVLTVGHRPYKPRKGKILPHLS